MMPTGSASPWLPAGLSAALLVGCVWRAGQVDGPCVVVVRAVTFAVSLLERVIHEQPRARDLLAVTSRAQVSGATLDDGVDPRDIEGRSALLLGLARDNDGSIAAVPPIACGEG